MNERGPYDVIVIGGGASGMMAASVASSRGKKVLLLEKNKNLGEKLKISPGGRCNITNAEEDERKLLKKYGKSEQLLYSSFSQFGVKETFSFFDERNLPLVVEANKRAFPATQKASDVFRVLEKCLTEGNVTVKSLSPVSKIETNGGRITNVIAGGESYSATSYILATGGFSHPETGSTGDGFVWLRDLGHTVVDPSPNIVPLKTKETWSHTLAGTSLTGMKITYFINGKKSFAEKGNVLFTHFGLSGPLVLNASGRVADLLQEGDVTAKIDCHPELEDHELEAKILSVFDAEKNKSLKNAFKLIAPLGTSSALLTLLPDIDPEKKVHSITKDERKQIGKLLKALPLTITGLMGFDRAVVADGGVVLEEMNMKTMRSLRTQNLFVTGDLLHINRPSGGYSLQLCWTTGYVAGTNA
jgi:predicted Rossmann fold flavoprotein